LQGQARRCVRH